MQNERIQFGIGYICFGALATWTAGALGLGSFETVLPALMYLGWGALGLFIFAHWRMPSSSTSKKGLPVPTDRDQSRTQTAILEHEIKNYLYSLKGNAKLLRLREANGANGHILDRIDRVVEKLEGLTQTVPVAMVQGNTPMTVIRKAVKPGEIARHCIHTYFNSQSDMFSWDMWEEDVQLLGDPDRFEQVYLNLYINAIEAGAEKVTTRVRGIGNLITVTIEDDGRGLAPQHLERIFEPFFTTKAGPTQRGLGMFIVQSIVESHGGKIRVQSKNGLSSDVHGLIFTLEIPKTPSANRHCAAALERL